jgi:hypothetical protein
MYSVRIIIIIILFVILFLSANIFESSYGVTKLIALRRSQVNYMSRLTHIQEMAFIPFYSLRHIAAYFMGIVR